MHNYHTEYYYFHANGDPLPGDVLIREMHNEDSDPFRSTAEEIITFCAANAIGAAGELTTLRTTEFRILPNHGGILLTALDHGEKAETYKKDDACSIVVPLIDLKDFASQATVRHMTYAIEEVLEAERRTNAAMLGLFYAFFNVAAKPRACEWLRDTSCPPDCKGPAYCPLQGNGA